jgi:ParB family chromosome partitioning protein
MSEQKTTIEAGGEFINLNSIQVGENTRTKSGLDKESLSALAASIKDRGVLQPVIVRKVPTTDGRPFMLIAGHRRFLASRLAGLSSIPALVTEADEGAALEIQIIENIQRENLGLYETAQAVRSMLALHGKPATVAEKLKKSKAWVSKHLTITAPTFPAEIAAMLADGTCEDLETLVSLGQIAKHPNGGALLPRLMTDVAEGRAGRTKVREALDALKNASQTEQPDEEGGEGGEDGENAEEEGPATITFNLNAKMARQFEALGGVGWLRKQLKKLDKAAE